MRVLGRIRLSRSKEESTSVERQREMIQQWAELNEHEIVGWAEDVDVSGSVSPFDAPELGHWLKAPDMHKWDVIVAWKLDRVARSSIELHRLFGWLEDNNKTIVCISDNIDLSNWVGKLVASVIAGVAEGELVTIRERVTAGKQKTREQGRFGGGRPTYGWKVVRNGDGAGWRIDLDPPAQVVLQRIIAEALSGKSTNQIAKDLTEDGIPSPANYYANKPGGTWTSNYIRLLLKNKTLLGWMTYESKPVLDATGKPIPKGPPALTLEQFDKLQEALADRSFKKTTSGETSPLLHILKCWTCGSDMHIRRFGKTPDRQRQWSYHCPKGCNLSNINAKEIEGITYAQFEDELGDFEVLEKVVPVYEDVDGELKEAQAAYGDVSKFLATAPDTSTRNMLFEQLDLIGQRIKALEAKQLSPTEVQWKPTGQTYKQLWEELDEQGKRGLLLKSGIIMRARQTTKGNRWHPGVIESEFIVPEDLKQRLLETS